MMLLLLYVSDTSLNKEMGVSCNIWKIEFFFLHYLYWPLYIDQKAAESTKLNFLLSILSVKLTPKCTWCSPSSSSFLYQAKQWTQQLEHLLFLSLLLTMHSWSLTGALHIEIVFILHHNITYAHVKYKPVCYYTWLLHLVSVSVTAWRMIWILLLKTVSVVVNYGMCHWTVLLWTDQVIMVLLVKTHL